MMTLKDRILDGMDLRRRIVEIGPLYRPFIRKADGNVIYVDHADTATLREKYKDDPKFSMDDIVEVDAVWGAKTLSECIGDPASYIIASHVIEHVPDLFTWLGELTDALAQGGQIRLVIPDKRFTFDYLRRPTELADVLDAYLRKTRTPLPRCILDHVLKVRNIDTLQAWAGPLDVSSLERPPGHGYELAVDTARKAVVGEYHDVHCWVFTPKSFAALMCEAVTRGLVQLKCVQFADTIRGSLEFVVFAEPCAKPQEALASWAAMETACFEQPDPETARLETQLDAARQELAQRHKGEDRLASELAVAKATIRELRQSTSWRVTAPLRRAVEAMRRVGFPAFRRHETPQHRDA